MLEFFLNVPTGAEADIHGTKRTFLVSFSLRGLFMLLLLAFYFQLPTSGVLASGLIALTMLTFALAFTLFDGNFEQWLISQCVTDGQGDGAFARSASCFWGGLVVGAGASVVTPAFLGFTPYILGALACFAAVAISLLVPEKGEEILANDSIAGPPAQLADDELSQEKTRQEVIDEAELELRRLVLLNRGFWGTALIYGLYQAIEATVPLVFFLKEIQDPPSVKFLVLVVCLWLPALLGSFSLLDFRRSDSSQRQSLPRISKLRQPALLFCGCSAMLPITSMFPASTTLWVLGAVIFVTRIAQGRLVPLLTSFNSTSTKLQTPKHVQKTVLSFGARRKNLTAMIALLIPVLAGFFSKNLEILY